MVSEKATERGRREDPEHRTPLRRQVGPLIDHEGFFFVTWAKLMALPRGGPGPRFLWQAAELTPPSVLGAWFCSHGGLLPLDGDLGPSPRGRGRWAAAAACGQAGASGHQP